MRQNPLALILPRFYTPGNIKEPKIIEEQGREKWQKQTGYSRRGVSENTFWRYKAVIGNKIHSKHDAAQKNEVHIGILVLNKFHKMGMPKSKAA